MIDLCRIKEDFSVLVKEAQPWTLTQFVMWLDLKLSEFKIKGYMVLDHHTKTKPKWIAEEDTTSDVAPTPATCRQCKKPTNDGTFYTDLQSSPSSHRTVATEQSQSVHRMVAREPKEHQPMDESESIRGDVGIIDLSHAENNRRNNVLPHHHPQQVNTSPMRTHPSLSFHDKPGNIVIERDKPRKEAIIEIDGSPTEKMFITKSDANKTSTPITMNPRPIQKPKNRPLSMGTAIYTSTTSSTSSTFSSSYMALSSRSTVPSFSNRKFALGAPPIPVTIQSNLDEMIAQAVQFNEISNQPMSGHSQGQTDTHQPPSRLEVEKHPVQPSFIEKHSEKISSNESNLNIFSQASSSTSAVPVALHANIDNITRDHNSQNSAQSSNDTLEIKIESDIDNSASDSFLMGELGQHSSMSDTSAQSHDISQLQSHDTSQFPSFTTEGLPKQGLVDPETARAFQMVELVSNSGVYVFEKTISQAFKVGTEHQTGTYSGEKMARYLLNVFWSRKELVGATLSKAGRGKKILNQQIIEAILDFCTLHGRHSRSEARQVLASGVTNRTTRERKKLLKRSYNLTPNLPHNIDPLRYDI